MLWSTSSSSYQFLCRQLPHHRSACPPLTFCLFNFLSSSHLACVATVFHRMTTAYLTIRSTTFRGGRGARVHRLEPVRE